MKPKKSCIHCGFPVGGGGDRHKKGNCPPTPKPGSNRFSRRRARLRKKQEHVIRVVRGAPVPHTGKPKGQSKT